MGLLDILFGVAEIVDTLSDKNTYFDVKCKNLEIFEIGTNWVGTARVHVAGKHLKTQKVNYTTKISMPYEAPSHSTKRDVLRKNLLNWVSDTFVNGRKLPKECIVLNPQENYLSYEAFAKKNGEDYTITFDPNEAEYYLSFKLNVYKETKVLNFEDLDYYFKAETTARVTSVDVRDGF